MKIFISQPMGNRAAYEIESQRYNAENKLQEKFGDITILDTYYKDYDGNACQHLGKSIIELGTADLAVFLEGWEDARGCRIEEQVAKEYGIERIYM